VRHYIPIIILYVEVLLYKGSNSYRNESMRGQSEAVVALFLFLSLLIAFIVAYYFAAQRVKTLSKIMAESRGKDLVENIATIIRTGEECGYYRVDVYLRDGFLYVRNIECRLIVRVTRTDTLESTVVFNETVFLPIFVYSRSEPEGLALKTTLDYAINGPNTPFQRTSVLVFSYGESYGLVVLPVLVVSEESDFASISLTVANESNTAVLSWGVLEIYKTRTVYAQRIVFASDTSLEVSFTLISNSHVYEKEVSLNIEELLITIAVEKYEVKT